MAKGDKKIKVDLNLGVGPGLTYAEFRKQMERMAANLGNQTFKENISDAIDDMNRGGIPKLKWDQDADAYARAVLTKALEVWERPLNWRFQCHRNAGQDSYLFVASYVDVDEGDTPIVEQAIEITAETLMYDEDNVLATERLLEDMWRKCEAELAMFE